MGWLYLSECKTKKQIVEHVKKYLEKSNKIIDDQLVGNSFWAGIQPKNSNDQLIFLAKLQKDHIGWGYKDMDETMGPFDFSCPIRLLERIPCPKSQFAEEWRQKVREYNQ